MAFQFAIDVYIFDIIVIQKFKTFSEVFAAIEIYNAVYQLYNAVYQLSDILHCTAPQLWSLIMVQ